MITLTVNRKAKSGFRKSNTKMVLFRMILTKRFLVALAIVVGLAGVIASASYAESTEEEVDGYLVEGRLLDAQDQPIVGAAVQARTSGEGEPLAEAESQEDGYWVLLLPEIPGESLTITIERPHFESQVLHLNQEELGVLAGRGIYSAGDLILERKITPGFWTATIIFIAVLLIIAFEKLHSTTAALAGASAIFLVTFMAVAFYPGLYIFSFEQALTYMNWEVIFLVMAMMIIIAIVERTGIFQ